MIHDISKTFLILVIVGAIASLLTAIVIGNTGLDLQLHDTYVVLDRLTLALVFATPIILMIFLFTAARNGFKKPGSNLGILAGLSLLIYITMIFRPIWNWLWMVAAMASVCAVLLIVRMMKTIRR